MSTIAQTGKTKATQSRTDGTKSILARGLNSLLKTQDPDSPPLQYAKALMELDAKNYETAKLLLLKAAEGNYPKAQNKLGDLYRDGLGVWKNPIKACRWYSLAAGQNFAEAQFNLWQTSGRTQGYYHLEKEYKLQLLIKAADLGHPKACYWLGREKRRAEKYDEAMELYNRAAEGGLSSAHLELGHIYNWGWLNQDVDLKKAYHFYSKSPTTYLIEFYLEGIFVEEDPEKAYQLFIDTLPNELDFDYFVLWLYPCEQSKVMEIEGLTYEMVFEWLQRGAEDGDVRAQFNLISCYFLGLGTDSNPDKALDLYCDLLRVTNGHQTISWDLSEFHKQEWIVKSDPETEFEWSLKTSNKVTHSKMLIGEAYLYGYGVENDLQKAWDWLVAASEDGNVEAKATIGNAIWELKPTVKDEVEEEHKAFSWWMDALEHGYDKLYSKVSFDKQKQKKES